MPTWFFHLNYIERDLNASIMLDLPQCYLIMSKARGGAAKKLHYLLEHGMKLLDSVQMCHVASKVLEDRMDQITEDFPTSWKSWAVHKNLKKVLEALTVIEQTVDAAVTGWSNSRVFGHSVYPLSSQSGEQEKGHGRSMVSTTSEKDMHNWAF